MITAAVTCAAAAAAPDTRAPSNQPASRSARSTRRAGTRPRCGTLLLVTYDRRLLDAVHVTRRVEVDAGTVRVAWEQ